MKLDRITGWLDRTLKVSSFDDVSNNGLQLDRDDDEVKCVAFAVDASVKAVAAAAAAGAGLLVVHHGFSWGGGVKRLTGGVGRVVRSAVRADLAIYAVHLPLDAHPTLGNNAGLAKALGLGKCRPAFCYHGEVIGLVGTRPTPGGGIETVGVCSGGAGSFAEDAKALGCDRYVTGEADWGEVVAAENAGVRMECLGHYATEVHGVRAVSDAMRRSLRIRTVDLTEELA